MVNLWLVATLLNSRGKNISIINVEISIEQIAYKCGFTDYSYFARVFSKTLGIAPSQYREKNRTLPY